MSVVVFDGDDAAYLAWLHAHPAGFVLSLGRDRRGTIAVLHRAGCGTIRKYSQEVRRGDFTARAVIKACGATLEPLLAFARADGGRPDGTFSARCRSCNPWSTGGGGPPKRSRR